MNIRVPLTYFVPVALLLALAACGSNGVGGGAPGGGGSGPEVLFGAPAEALLNTFVDATVDSGTGVFSSVSILVVPYLGSAGIAAVGVQFLYVSVPDGQLFGYSIALAPITGSPFASGTNEQLVVDPSGKFLYASDDDPPGGILAFTIGPTGALNAVPGSPFAIPGQTNANSQPVGIVDTGSFVYAGLTADNEIAAFSIDAGTGALARVPGSPFSAGSFPDVLALANNFLYAANWQDFSISAYSSRRPCAMFYGD